MCLYAEYLAAMSTTPMAWSVLATGPYAERLWGDRDVPVKDADGIYVFKLPLGEGAMPLVALDSIGIYAKVSRADSSCSLFPFQSEQMQRASGN